MRHGHPAASPTCQPPNARGHPASSPATRTSFTPNVHIEKDSGVVRVGRFRERRSVRHAGAGCYRWTKTPPPFFLLLPRLCRPAFSCGLQSTGSAFLPGERRDALRPFARSFSSKRQESLCCQAVLSVTSSSVERLGCRVYIYSKHCSFG